MDFGLWSMEHQAVGTPCFVALLEYRPGHFTLLRVRKHSKKNRPCPPKSGFEFDHAFYS